jgi:hypothetical protein
MQLKVGRISGDGGYSFEPIGGSAEFETSMRIENRTVALFDVLGFRDRVKSTPLSELLTSYRGLLRQADAYNQPLPNSPVANRLFPTHPTTSPWCHQYIFSDSIVMLADSSSIDSCLRLLVASWRLFQFFLAAGFPLRGGISHGEISIESGVLIGSAIVDAFELEASQNWIGAAIHRSVIEAYPEINREMQTDGTVWHEILRLYPVPMKNGSAPELPTLNWRFNLLVKDGTRSLFPHSDIPDIQTKQNNTLDYARAVAQSGRLYIQDGSLAELKAMWVGNVQPPFEHGDDL